MANCKARLQPPVYILNQSRMAVKRTFSHRAQVRYPVEGHAEGEA